VALVSDAGTPGISDPGYILIREAIERGIETDVLPGANAILPALLLSGIAPQPFTFVGFLEGDKADRAKRASALAELQSTLIFYVAPHDLAKDLVFLAEKLGNRDAAIVREISKVHQETIRGRLRELIETALSREVRGEIVLVTSGRPDEQSAAPDWRKEARHMKERGIFDKEIANALFESYRIQRNVVKAFLLESARGAGDSSERPDGNQLFLIREAAKND